MNHLHITFASVPFLLIAVGAAHADGDAVNGDAVFKRCVICHTLKAGEPNKAQ